MLLTSWCRDDGAWVEGYVKLQRQEMDFGRRLGQDYRLPVVVVALRRAYLLQCTLADVRAELNDRAGHRGSLITAEEGPPKITAKKIVPIMTCNP